VLVADISRRNASFFSDDDAVVAGDGAVWSWGQLDERANRMAHLFDTLGLAQGDRVAVLSPNDRDYITFFLACSKSGVLGAPLNIRLTAVELTSYLRYVEPIALLVHVTQRTLALALVEAIPSLQHVIGFGGSTEQPHGFPVDLDGALASQPTSDPGRVRDPGTPYMLAATSGTTGVAKAALLTNANAIAAMLTWTGEMPMHERDTALQNIPLFFNPGGPAGLHPVMMKGGRTVIFPGFDPGTFLVAVPQYAVTHTIIVPTMVRMVLNHPDARRHDLSTLRGITSGGSPISADLLRAARSVFGDVFYPTYGMAETYSCGLVLRPENQHPDGDEVEIRRLASAGKPHTTLQVRVVRDDGTSVTTDAAEVGEVLVAGDTVASEYFRMPDETAEAFRDGWMHTGDLATVDDGGFITIVDRKKDVIISGGINVHGREVEEVLLAHPSIGQAAVIGVPDERWGEVVHAVVVAAPGAEIDSADVLLFCRERLADYKRPRTLEVRPDLPMSATGKVLKRALRDTLPG
jgi:acyl-CoA synthetase (AMP-forming)/AMP-acid ligase II